MLLVLPLHGSAHFAFVVINAALGCGDPRGGLQLITLVYFDNIFIDHCHASTKTKSGGLNKFLLFNPPPQLPSVIFSIQTISWLYPSTPGGNGDGSTCRNATGHISDSNGIQITDIVGSVVGYPTGVNRWDIDTAIRAALDIGDKHFIRFN